MIQFNLLPDIKKEYIKAKNTKRLIVSLSVMVAAGAIVLTGLMYSYVQISQKGQIEDLSADISKEITGLQGINDLDKILTIQNQLISLNESEENSEGLHEKKPETSRIFGYLYQLTPETVKIQDITLDFKEEVLTISGSAESLAEVNKYVDTFKFSTYEYEDDDEKKEGTPFKDVVSELNRGDQEASYTVKMTFNPELFDNTKDITLVIPKDFVSTRSTTEKPSLFEGGDE